jgi:hypothetical protein
MDRPSSLAIRSRQRRSSGFRLGSRSFLRVALLALVLAFGHVWESVTMAELRTRIDHARTHHDELNLRLCQLTSQLAQWTARAEATAGVSSTLGFAIPKDGQVVLLSANLVDAGSGRNMASGPASHSLWDWVAGTAEAGSRGTSASLPTDESVP